MFFMPEELVFHTISSPSFADLCTRILSWADGTPSKSIMINLYIMWFKTISSPPSTESCLIVPRLKEKINLPTFANSWLPAAQYEQHYIFMTCYSYYFISLVSDESSIHSIIHYMPATLIIPIKTKTMGANFYFRCQPLLSPWHHHTV